MTEELNYRCGKGRVMETDDWRALHKDHGTITETENEKQPPAGYRLWTLTCTCGARHTLSKDA